MKIAVCIKQVVTREWQVRINEARTWVRDQDASWELNEPDAYALEESLRLREKHGGEVIVVSAGPARVTQVLPRRWRAAPIAPFTSRATSSRPPTP
jgi:electron transfer flavoprotein beta subunit